MFSRDVQSNHHYAATLAELESGRLMVSKFGKTKVIWLGS